MSPAGTCHYIVVRIGEAWWVDVEGKPFGPWESRDHAVSASKKLIEAFADDTRPADIWAPADDDRMERVWRNRA